MQSTLIIDAPAKFQWRSRAKGIALHVIVATMLCDVAGLAQINSWTNPASGKWEELKWSLGLRPSTNQSVLITNFGWKAVSIDTATTTSFAGSLMVRNIEASAPAGDRTTLLLNYADTAAPLRVLDGIVVGTNGVLMNLSSGIIAGSNGISIVGGEVVQAGGFVHATNGASKLDGSYNLTNAALRLERLDVGTYSGGNFTQSGGQVGVRNLNLTAGGYSLQLGAFTSDLIVVGASSYSQSGGTNQTKVLALNGNGFGPPNDFQYFWGSYSLDGGALLAETVSVGDSGLLGQFFQSGGVCRVTNALTIQGQPGYPREHGKISRYRNTGGILVAQDVDARQYSSFEQTSGTSLISGAFGAHGQITYWSPETLLYLSGGLLCCSNFVCDAADFTQTGGTLWITNLMRFSGSYCPNSDSVCSAAYRCTNGNLIASTVEIRGRFHFAGSNASIAGAVSLIGTPNSTQVVENSLSGGTFTCLDLTSVYRDLAISGSAVTVSNSLSISGLIVDFGQPPPVGFASLSVNSGSLTASNISVEANMYIKPGVARITNSGAFSLSGYLSITDADERLGRFVLKAGAQPGYVSISLGGTATRLRFADSSSEGWSAGETLLVRNWSGSTNGGGDDQLSFGTSYGGLTSSQLAQLRFVDPVGFPPGNYGAKILSTGEVVPTTQPMLYPTSMNGQLTLSWSNASALQTSTNVTGPFVDVPGATSPYTNTPAGDKQRFFRLRQ